MMLRFVIIIMFPPLLLSQSISDKFAYGMNAYHHQLYADAHKVFTEIVEKYGIEDELYTAARYYAADALLKMGKKDEAASEFEYIANNVTWSNFRKESLYNLGLIYYDAKRYSLSRSKFITLINDYPGSDYTGSAYYWIGESYSEENRQEEAIEFLTRAIEDKNNFDYRDYTIYALASVYEKTGDYENAVKYYDELLTHYPDSDLAIQAQMRIGVCYFQLKEYNTSILELNNPILADLPPESFAEGLYLLANSYYRIEDYKNAAETYTEILDKFPGSLIIRNAKYGLAWSFFQQGKYNDAYNVFNSLSEGEDSIAVKSFIWKGESKRYAGNYNEALDVFKQFLQKYPGHELAPLVEYQIGLINFEQNKFEPSIEYLTNATSSEDEITRAKAFTLIGEIELQKKNYIKARAHFEPAVKITEPETDIHQRALFGLAIVSFNLKEYDKAIEYLKQVETINPSFETTKVSFYLAETYFASGKYQEALTRYSSMKPDDPDISKQVIYSKAYCFFNLGKYDNAAYQFSEFLKSYPNDKRSTDTKLRLADSYYGSKNYSAASRVFRDLYKSGSFTSNDPYDYYQYAQALFKSGESDEAINQFLDLQRKFPSSQYAENSLYTVGWIRFQQGEFDESINDYYNVLAVYKKSSLAPIVYYSIGDAYFNMEKYDSAIVNYQKVLSRYPSSEHVYDAINGIQYSYVAMGKPSRAIDLIDQFINRNPNLKFSDQVYFKKGEIYYSQRDYQNAKISYQEFLVKYPNSSFVPEAYYWLGKSSANLKQNDEAELYFRKVFDNYPNSDPADVSVIELGGIYDASGNYQAAVDLFNKATTSLKDSPRLPEILFMKGMAYVKLNNIPKSYETFSELAMYHADDLFADRARFEMGLIDLSAVRYETADEHFLYVAGKRNDDLGAKSQYYYGLSLFEQQKTDEAITALEKVREAYSIYDEWISRSYLLLGDCYVKLDDNHKAEEYYRSVLAKHKGDELGNEARQKLNKL